jgi:hypothetical protein
MPDHIKTIGLYEQDFFAWGLAQAEALRSAWEAVQHATHETTLRQMSWERPDDQGCGTADPQGRDFTR